jgi:putative NADH-flavin reductase
VEIVVLGAAGGVGRQVVQQARERDHRVRAMARTVPGWADRKDGRVRWQSGDVRDDGLLADMVGGADAVLWCVGVTGSSGADVGRAALPGLVAAMATHGVQRLVGVSGAGADLPGDNKGVGARVVSALTHRLGRAAVEDKEGEFRVLSLFQLSWTQVRPPRLTDQPGTGRYELTDQAPGLGAPALSRADVATAMLDLSTPDATTGQWPGQWLRRAPFVVAARD